MKLTNLSLIVAMIFICFVIIDDIKTEELAQITQVQSKLNNILDNAVEDAMVHLVETDSGRDKIVNKEEAVSQFLTNVYINLDIMENNALKERLRGYIPVIGVIEEDGFYLSYSSKETVNEEVQMRSVFSQKYTYTKIYEEYKINYTLGDYIYITNLVTGENDQGNYHDIRERCPIQHLLDDTSFEEERRQVITQLFMETISYYINQHNKIAKQFGLQYEFALPVIEKEEWYRTIDDISMIVFFQGYPYGRNQTGYYNRVVIGGGRVRKVANKSDYENY